MITIPARLNVEEEIPKRMLDIFDFNLRCASPGIVESFDAVKQTVKVRIAISERIRCDNPEFVKKHSSNVGPETIPILVDVPICVPSAGGFSLTLPIKEGDECLVIFSDTCFDAWYQNGCQKLSDGYEPQDQMSLRRHDLSDAFAIMGIRSQPKVLSGYKTDSTQLRNDAGDNYVELSPSALNLVFGATKVILDVSGITCTGNVLMNDNLDVIGETVLEDTTTIETKVFLLHKHNGVVTGGAQTQGVA